MKKYLNWHRFYLRILTAVLFIIILFLPCYLYSRIGIGDDINYETLSYTQLDTNELSFSTGASGGLHFFNSTKFLALGIHYGISDAINIGLEFHVFYRLSSSFSADFKYFYQDFNDKNWILGIIFGFEYAGIELADDSEFDYAEYFFYINPKLALSLGYHFYNEIITPFISLQATYAYFFSHQRTGLYHYLDQNKNIGGIILVLGTTSKIFSWLRIIYSIHLPAVTSATPCDDSPYYCSNLFNFFMTLNLEIIFDLN